MPRTARQNNKNGYQHIIVRGIGKQVLFEDKIDHWYFIKLLEKYSKETGTGICAYCLMDNHVHMLVHDKDDQTQLLMKKLGVSYAAYYNKKYDRTGHLFQDRYRNEAVLDDRYYLTVLRYILRNPEKAGMCKSENYRWSSYHMFGAFDTFLDQTHTMELLRDEVEYRYFIAEENQDECLEYERRHDDEWARSVIKRILGVESGTIIQSYGRIKRDESLRKLKMAGISIRRLERLTGINRGVIQKA